jgi:alkylation response protein AidB-like acyl-CoA dehydrogenase
MYVFVEILRLQFSYAPLISRFFIFASDIVHYGTEAQKEKYLPKMITGEWIAAIASKGML